MTPETAAHVRFVVLRGLPMLVVDLEEGADPHRGTDTGTDDGAQAGGQVRLFPLLVERGLMRLPRFYGHDLPRGAQVGVTLTAEELKIEDEQETRLLRLPRASVPEDWEAAAKRLKGTMLIVGRELGVDPDHSPKELCDLLEDAAGDDRIAGAIVGVAEPREGLPFFSLS